MIETMYEANGVGLAAPQVGILKRIVVIDVGEGPIVMINPKILETSGSQTGSEGCLSVPGKNGTVTRPMWVKAEFYGEDMEKYIIAIVNRSDYYDRYWVTRDTLEEARKVAQNYDDNHQYQTSIYKIGEDLRYE